LIRALQQGLGEKADNLQPFEPKQFAQALFEE